MQFLSFCFQSELIFESIQIFIVICTKFDRVREIELEVCG